MIYLIVSRGIEVSEDVTIEAETPLHVKAPNATDEELPIVGFESLALAELFMDRRKIPGNEYKFVLKGSGLSEKYDNKRIFLVTSESQLEDMEQDPDGYDYESNILRIAP